MPCHELNRQLSRATGESRAELHRLGFRLDGVGDDPAELEPIDWDALAAARRSEVHRCGRPRVAFG